MCRISAALRIVLTCKSTRIHFGRLSGTGISFAHIRATPVQPRVRAARAGNCASRSSVTVKITLAISSARRSFLLISNCRSSSVRASISSRLLCSTVVAPRIPRQYISQQTPFNRKNYAPVAPGTRRHCPYCKGCWQVLLSFLLPFHLLLRKATNIRFDGVNLFISSMPFNQIDERAANYCSIGVAGHFRDMFGR